MSKSHYRFGIAAVLLTGALTVLDISAAQAGGKRGGQGDTTFRDGVAAGARHDSAGRPDGGRGARRAGGRAVRDTMRRGAEDWPPPPRRNRAASGGVTVTEAKVQGGRLIVTGMTPSANQPVELDSRFTATSDASRI